MSDYMFMLESHLSSDQSRVVSEIQAAAANANVNVFLTGGAMRDMLGGFPIHEVDFTVGVVNRTSEYLPHAALMIRLAPGMRLLGRPTHERGRGCTGDSTLACDLDFLEGHMETRVHLGVRIEPNAPARVALTAWGVAGDEAGPKTSFTVVTGSS